MAPSWARKTVLAGDHPLACGCEGCAWTLLPLVRELLSQHPGYRHHAARELVHVLYSLGYVEDLVDEGEIEAAVEVAWRDYPQWESPAA